MFWLHHAYDKCQIKKLLLITYVNMPFIEKEPINSTVTLHDAGKDNNQPLIFNCTNAGYYSIVQYYLPSRKRSHITSFHLIMYTKVDSTQIYLFIFFHRTQNDKKKIELNSLFTFTQAILV